MSVLGWSGMVLGLVKVWDCSRISVTKTCFTVVVVLVVEVVLGVVVVVEVVVDVVVVVVVLICQLVRSSRNILN